MRVGYIHRDQPAASHAAIRRPGSLGLLGRPADIESFRHLTHSEDVEGSTVTRLVPKGPRAD
jgi:hypothetical protein